MMNIDFMEKAIEIAKTSENDIPIGAIIVLEGQIIARAVNKREKENRAVAHAEILAIEEANKKLGSWRLNNCDLSLPDFSISRVHCCMYIESGQLFLENNISYLLF